MTEKVFRVIDGFDCENKPCKLIENTITTERYNTENTLEANSLCELLNEKEERIKTLTEENEELKIELKGIEKENHMLNGKVNRLTDELANCYEKLGW